MGLFVAEWESAAIIHVSTFTMRLFTRKSELHSKRQNNNTSFSVCKLLHKSQKISLDLEESDLASSLMSWMCLGFSLFFLT